MNPGNPTFKTPDNPSPFLARMLERGGLPKESIISFRIESEIKTQILERGIDLNNLLRDYCHSIAQGSVSDSNQSPPED
jgi:hypothetical protein